MDDDISDYGGDLADRQADESFYAEHNMCPDCETKYDKDGNCEC